MCRKKFKFGDRVQLLVTVIHDDLLRFHYPGEEAIFIARAADRLRFKIGDDTIDLSIDEVTPLDD